jgi:hypothetical protein
MMRRLAERLVHASFAAAANATAVIRAPRVCVYYALPHFGRKAKAIADLLRRRQLPARVCTGLSGLQLEHMRHSHDLWIGYWNRFPSEWLPRHFIFLSAEPLAVSPYLTANWRESMRRAFEIWEYSKTNWPHILSAGVPIRYVPFGYAPYYEASFRAHTAGYQLKEDIDVLFVGSLSKRRTALLKRLRGTGMTVKGDYLEKPNPWERT